MMQDAQLDELLAVAVAAGRAGAEVIRSRRDSFGEVYFKDTGSSLAGAVVTDVDRAAQAAILAIIEPTCVAYDLGLLAEEDNDNGSRLRHDAFWCVDPLDGTLAFVEGRAGYSVSIALVAKDGTPLIGVCVDPVTGVLYQARQGGGAWRDGEPFEPSANAEHLRFFTDRSFTHHPRFSDAVAALEPLARELGLSGVEVDTSGGGVMFAMWSLERGPGCYFKFPKPTPGGGSSWDYAASSCIYRELGLPAGDITGQPLPLNDPNTTFMNGCGVCYATSPAIAEGVYRIARALQ